MHSSSDKAAESVVRIIFFGDDYFFSDTFFHELLGAASCVLVACVAPPMANQRPQLTRLMHFFRGIAGWLSRERWDHLVTCGRIGYFSSRRSPSPASIAEPKGSRSWLDYVRLHPEIPLLRPKAVRQPTADFVKVISELKPDVFVSVGYTKIIGEQLLSIPRMGAFNIHPSKLPLYRGGYSVFFALRDGASEVGMTCHRIVPAVDAGDIAYQEVLQVGKRAKIRDTYDALISRSKWMARRLLEDLLNSAVPSIEQTGPTSFYLFPKREDMWVDWAKPGSLVESLVCAVGGEAWTILRGVTVNVVDGAFIPGVVKEAKPGTVVDLSEAGIDVACAEDSIFRITRLSFAAPLPFMQPMQVDASLVARKLRLRPTQDLSGF